MCADSSAIPYLAVPEEGSLKPWTQKSGMKSGGRRVDGSKLDRFLACRIDPWAAWIIQKEPQASPSARSSTEYDLASVYDELVGLLELNHSLIAACFPGPPGSGAADKDLHALGQQLDRLRARQHFWAALAGTTPRAGVGRDHPGPGPTIQRGCDC